MRPTVWISQEKLTQCFLSICEAFLLLKSESSRLQMNRNNNAATMQGSIQVVNTSDSIMLHSAANQEKNLENPMSNLMRPNFHGAGLTPSSYMVDDVFSNSPSGVPPPNGSNHSPPIFRSNPPVAYHSPSRSLSMPASSPVRPFTFGPISVRQAPPNSLFSPHTNYSTGNGLRPLQSMSDYRSSSHSTHIMSR